MRDIDKIDYEVWYKANVKDNESEFSKPRRICAFHFKFDAEDFIERQHESIKDNYYLKVVGESGFYPNVIF